MFALGNPILAIRARMENFGSESSLLTSYERKNQDPHPLKNTKGGVPKKLILSEKNSMGPKTTADIDEPG
jgi:hypothetical protein